MNRRTIAPFRTIGAKDMLDKKLKRPTNLVEEILPFNTVNVIAGQTGSGKSLWVHALGLSIALGLKEFFGFKINKNKKVLYLCFEMDEITINERNTKLINFIMKNYYNKKLHKGNLNDLQIFTPSSEERIFDSHWEQILDTIRQGESDLTIIDNLYSTTNADEEKNYKLKPLLQEVDQARKETGTTLLLVTHHVKGQHDIQYLNTDLVRGGSTLCNFADTIYQIAKSVIDPNLKIWKMTKNRHGSEYDNIPLAMSIDSSDDEMWINNDGVIEDEQEHLKELSKNIKLETLKTIDKKFTTEEWLTHVVDNYKRERKTAFNWLNSLQNEKRIEKIEHGKYQKVEVDNVV